MLVSIYKEIRVLVKLSNSLNEFPLITASLKSSFLEGLCAIKVFFYCGKYMEYKNTILTTKYIHMLGNHHHSVVPEPFHHFQRKPVTGKQSFPTLPFSSPFQPDEWINNM